MTIISPQKTSQVVILTKSHEGHSGACEIVLDKLMKLWKKKKKEELDVWFHGGPHISL